MVSVLFISDLRLEVERPGIIRALPSFLDKRARRTKTPYILGGFFEVWISNDGIDVLQRPIAQSLRQVADGGTRIYLVHSNRDPPIGGAFCHEAGCMLLPDPSVIDLYDEPVLLMHGDSLYTRGEAYARLCRRLRNLPTFWVLHHSPLTARRKLACKLCKESRTQARIKAINIIGVTPGEVPRAMCRHGVCTSIRGYTHRPAEYLLDVGDQPAWHTVLGDWNRQGWALEVDANDHRQASFPLWPTPGPPCGPLNEILCDSYFLRRPS